MYDFESYRCGDVDWPVSTVKRRGKLKTEMAQRLDEFEGLALSAQDEGFLRLARIVLESQSSPQKSGDGLGDGLIS
jgi:hypothetical protein